MNFIIKIFFTVCIGAGAFYLTIKNVNFNESLKAYKNVPIALQLGVMFFFFLTHVFRAIRWKFLQEDLHRVSLIKTYAIHSVGFLGIFILPFRLGELIRPGLLKKKLATPLSKTLTYVFIERVWDGLTVCLFLFIGIKVSLSQGLVISEAQSLKIAYYLNKGMVLFFGLGAFLIFTSFVLNHKYDAIKRYPIWQSYGEHVHKALNIVLSSKKNVVMLLYSFLIWGSAVGAYWLMFKIYDFPLSFFSAMTVLGLLSLGLMIPGPPGFVGVFHFFIQVSLSIFLIGPNEAFAYASSLYLVNAIYIILSGIWGYFYTAISINDIRQSMKNKA